MTETSSAKVWWTTGCNDEFIEVWVATVMVYTGCMRAKSIGMVCIMHAIMFLGGQHAV
jgi:hypothetical protein